MKHSTELERTIVPGHGARLRACETLSIGNSCAFAGIVALHIMRVAGGNVQMRRRAFVTGGDS